MARLPRLIIPSQAHYILLISNEGAPLFRDRLDFERMFNFIYEQAVREDVLVHAYTLLSSQVHMMVTPKNDEGLSKMMQGLGRSYVRYFNNRYDRAGTLWGGRYKSSVVQSGEWLRKCLIYMDYLPQRSSAHQAPGDYEWSSHLHYIGRRNDVFLTAHEEVWNLGNTPFAREEQYELMIRKGLSSNELLHIEQTLKGGWILGDDTFIEHLQRSTHRRVAKAKPGRPSKALSAPSRGMLTG